MYWYYEKRGQQAGPFTEEQFQQAVHSGEVQPNTLVWNETLSGWVPYNTIARSQTAHPEPAPTPPVPISYPPSGTQVCSQCSQSFGHENMIQYSNLWICSNCKNIFFQRLKEGGRAGGAWRDGNFMVASKGATLPDRCVKCNAPAQGLKLTRKLYWHPPAYYLLACAGLLIYAIVALIVRRNTVLDIGICPEHKTKRKRGIAIAWSLVAVSFILFFVGISADKGALLAFAGILFLGAIVYGIVESQFVTPRKIEPDGLVWLKGINQAYLQQLPSYQSF